MNHIPKKDISNLFIAIDLPKGIIKAVKSVQKHFESANDFEVKLVNPEQLHLTLLFLGATDQALIPKIIESLENIKTICFNISLDRIGLFPCEKYPKIIWLGVKKNIKELEKLQNQIEDSLSWINNNHENNEKKEFVTHLTIARTKFIKDSEKLLKFMNQIKMPKLEFAVTSFKLKKSEISQNGLKYTNIHEFNLDI